MKPSAAVESRGCGGAARSDHPEGYARCDQELERIAAEAANATQPAWLIAMALMDWIVERDLIEQEAQRG